MVPVLQHLMAFVMGVACVLSTAQTLAASDVGVKFAPPFGNVTLPDRPASAHWVWVHEFINGTYGKATLVDADTGKILGMLDTGWEGIKLEDPGTGDYIYSAQLYWDRGFRGKRIEIVAVINRSTLEVEAEIPIPAKQLRGFPSNNYSQLSEDGRFMVIQFFTPAATVGVVDLKARKFVGEIDEPGCAMLYATGGRSFMTLCGNGSVRWFTLDDDGALAESGEIKGFFDAQNDPILHAGVRDHNVWYFVSYNGVIHSIRAGAAPGDLTVLPEWRVTTDSDRAERWAPGSRISPLTIQRRNETLYVLMNQKGDLHLKPGRNASHAEPGIEAWEFDLKSHRRLRRISLQEPSFAISVSQGKEPLLYSTAFWHDKLQIYNLDTGERVRKVEQFQTPGWVQPVE